jgi:fructose-1,6-bisphosphatase I
VSKAGLLDAIGKTGQVNIQGEEVMKLDEFANRTLYQALDHTGLLCVMASEEDESILPIPKEYPCGKYVLNFDPLDGSSNIDANVSVGTIFSILKKDSSPDAADQDCCKQKGTNQVGAGYIIYGSSTMFVYTVGHGVHGFTFDSNVGEFILSHEYIKTPARGKIYSANEGNYNKWDTGVRKYIDYVKEINKEDRRPYTSRYIGSLVADFHRNLLYGGIFLYPGDKLSPTGKLRLLYEANPLSFVVEQAGGMSSDGQKRILDIEPTTLHQKTPLIIGSKYDVELACEFVQEKR